MIAQLFGQLAIRIWPLLDEEDEAPLFCDFLRRSVNAQTRVTSFCAYNFPVCSTHRPFFLNEYHACFLIPSCVESDGARKYALHLHSVLQVSGRHTRTGAALWLRVHDIALPLGGRAVKHLKDAVVKLLRDESRGAGDDVSALTRYWRRCVCRHRK